MEQNFQTSFMPKKPMIEERVSSARPVGILAVLSIFIFFAMLVATGGLYFYKGVAVENLAQRETDLATAKNRFEPSKIVQMQVLDKRLRASTEVLNNHIAISPIFKMLEELTMKTVRYTKFAYSMGEGSSSKVSFKINGQAIGYRSIALQSDLLTKNKQIIDPIFSDLSLDEKGNVVFVLDFSVDPSVVDYKQMLKAGSEEVNTPIVMPVNTPLPSVPDSTTNTTPGMIPSNAFPPVVNTTN